jgi:hypothetical protein
MISGGRVKVKEVVEELDELDELEELGMGSVVPGMVVKEPSGSVDTDGGIVVKDALPLGGDSEAIGSVVPGIVVKDPSGSVRPANKSVTISVSQ